MKKTRCSTAYLCVSLLLVLLLLFVPLFSFRGEYFSGVYNRGEYFTGIYSVFNMSDPDFRNLYGGFVLISVAILLIGLLLHNFKNNSFVKWTRVFLNIVLLAVMFFVMWLLNGHFEYMGIVFLSVVAAVNLVLAIAMSRSRKKEKAVAE